MVRILGIVMLSVCSFAAFGQNWDVNLLKSINGKRTAGTDALMEPLSNTDYYVAGAVPVVQYALGYLSGNKNLKMDAVETLIGYGYGLALTYAYKYTIQKDRPYVTYPSIIPYSRETDPTFPSGHACMAFSAATSVSLCYPKWYVMAPAYIWAGAVGYSQVYLGMHYPSDVLMGAICGAGSAWLSQKTTDWLDAQKKRKVFMAN